MKKTGALFVLFLFSFAYTTVREVGPGKTYSSINNAYTAAAQGDSIQVYPQAGNTPYPQVAVYATKSRIVISGVMGNGGRVPLDGTGYDYSGAGSTPRAMFQFNPGTDSCVVENFKISNCNNTSYNGAAFRINQANYVTIRNCEILNNDMGIMSNGTVAAQSASNQLIENCIIHDNGDTGNPGYNHNLYLGGYSVTVRGCNIYNATTGHNLKSRAHQTFVEGCYIHDSPNRELDLVDDAVTTVAAESHALLSGCVIVKAASTTGNRGTIHFGQDLGNDHNGTLYAIHCTILTPYISPVVDLSAPNAGASFWNCIIMDPTGSQTNQALTSVHNGASAANVYGHNLWLSSGFPAPIGANYGNITVGASSSRPSFANDTAGDYHLASSFAGVVDAGATISGMGLPSVINGRALYSFALPLGTTARMFTGTPDLGAYEWSTTGIFHCNTPGVIVSANERGTQCVYDIFGKKANPITRGATGIYFTIKGEDAQKKIYIPAR